MDDFALLHRPSSKNLECFGPHTLVWKTCLRQIAFVNAACAKSLWQPGDEIFEGSQAFVFLLEVICGLRSPVVGETEVFGQFKNFVADQSLPLNQALPMNQELQLRGFFQALIQSAKNLRAEHLVGLGSQGYGSLVRKLSKADSAVCILGAGQLAAEIIPWLIKAKSVQLVCRDVSRAQCLKESHSPLQVLALDDRSAVLNACLVVAAPLSDKQLHEWLQLRAGQVRKILDLRGELQEPALFKDYHFIGLKDVFGNIEKNKLELEEKITQLKELIQLKAMEHSERIFYRPFGWEDLCV